jgi:hypothetical protein
VTPPWWRKRRRTLPDESDHAQRVSEAESAIQEGRRTLAEANRLGDEIAEMSDELGRRGRRNHFSELIAEMLHDQTGGSSPAPRRG